MVDVGKWVGVPERCLEEQPKAPDEKAQAETLLEGISLMVLGLQDDIAELRRLVASL